MPIFQDESQTITIGTHVIKRLDGVRTLLIDNAQIRFTPTEYRLILPLLEGNAVGDEELIAVLFNSSIESRMDDDFWAREALSRHIDRIRRKFKQHRVRIAIRRVAAFGYILIPYPFVRKI